MSAHTPGPWFVDRDPADINALDVLVSLKGCHATVATVLAEKKIGPKEKADARLIAAAPDLLEALTALSKIYGNTWDKVDGGLMMMDKKYVSRFEDAHAAAQAAIAKATQP